MSRHQPARRSTRPGTAAVRRGSRRGSPQVRLRVGFVMIAMVLSLFGARLVQLQGLDPGSYAAMAAAEGTVDMVLPAERGDILDRNGQPLAASIDGLMIVGGPADDRGAGTGDRPVPRQKLDVDYFTVLKRLREKDSRFEYLARHVPSTLANDVLQEADDRGYKGLSTRRDAVRTYPAHDVAANLIGFLGTDQAYGGLEEVFNKALSGKDGSEKYEVGAGNRIPLGDNTTVPAVDGQDLHTTIDRDLQWYTQRVLRQAARSPAAPRRSRWSWTPGPARCSRSPTTRPTTPTTRAALGSATGGPARSTCPTSPARSRRCSRSPRCSTRARSPPARRCWSRGTCTARTA